MHPLLRFCALSLVALPTLAFAEQKAAEAPVPPTPVAETPAPAAPPAPIFKKIAADIDLQDGDTFVFLGDSITHQCLYTQYVEDYFYTRYPERRIRFHNAGVSGDRAEDALQRFDEDVAVYKPKYVSVLLGMNDGSYRGFDAGIFNSYEKHMEMVLDRIEEIGATAILITPTMHDARAARAKGGEEPRDTYYNGVLALYGAWLREEAQVRGLGFVDMWGPLNRISLEKRKSDANWTMIPDAVHPAKTGQVVMAAAIIRDMVKPSDVSEAKIDLSSEPPAATAVNGTVTDVEKTDQGLSFSFKSNALPWVLPLTAAEGTEVADLAHGISRQPLRVSGLTPGNYRLSIDGKDAGIFSASAFGEEIDLSQLSVSPDRLQALHVADLNEARNGDMWKLRDLFSALKGRRSELWRANDSHAPDLDNQKAAFETWHNVEFRDRVTEVNAKIKEGEDLIYKANQPEAHRYEVTLAK